MPWCTRKHLVKFFNAAYLATLNYVSFIYCSAVLVLRVSVFGSCSHWLYLWPQSSSGQQKTNSRERVKKTEVWQITCRHMAWAMFYSLKNRVEWFFSVFVFLTVSSFLHSFYWLCHTSALCLLFISITLTVPQIPLTYT